MKNHDFIILHVGMDDIMAKVVIDSADCWLWQGNLNDDGYPRITVKGKTLRAHIVAYAIWKGIVSDGLELDHTCIVRKCVNPDHLEPVTHIENMYRTFRTHPITGKKHA